MAKGIFEIVAVLISAFVAPYMYYAMQTYAFINEQKNKLPEYRDATFP